MLEHIPSESLALSEIHRILKPSGVLLIFSPNRIYPFETHQVTFKLSQKPLPLFIPFLPYLPVRVGKHFLSYFARNYFPWELNRILNLSGFQPVARDFEWQTLENISGFQPELIRKLRPWLFRVLEIFSKIPGIRIFGISQFLVAKKS